MRLGGGWLLKEGSSPRLLPKDSLKHWGGGVTDLFFCFYDDVNLNHTAFGNVFVVTFLQVFSQKGTWWSSFLPSPELKPFFFFPSFPRPLSFFVSSTYQFNPPPQALGHPPAPAGPKVNVSRKVFVPVQNAPGKPFKFFFCFINFPILSDWPGLFCFVVINPCLLSANRVDLFFFFFYFI